MRREEKKNASKDKKRTMIVELPNFAETQVYKHKLPPYRTRKQTHKDKTLNQIFADRTKKK